MKGFLRRDFYLLMLNIWFFLPFLVTLGVLGRSVRSSGIIFFYIMIFCASALIGLFSYDEANHWQAYAATAPNGRKAQVDGRYVLAFLIIVAGTAFMLVLSLLNKILDSWTTPLMYAGMMLIYVDLIFPLSYQFGSRSRLIMIVIMATIAGVIGVGSSILTISGVGDLGMDGRLFRLSVPLVGIGLVGMILSHRISVAIMKRKEL